MKRLTHKATFILILFLLIGSALGAFVLMNINSDEISSQTFLGNVEQNANVIKYSSKDLKISFEYPDNWLAEEEDRMILISNYKNSLSRNIKPNNNQIEITIDEFANCLSSLEEDLIDPACGQGSKKNKIISKKVKQVDGGEFLSYSLETYDKNQRNQYFFQKDNKILQIGKTPDSSQFEKEFEDIVNSIRFQD